MKLQLPYSIKCESGNMSFSDGDRWDSSIDSEWSDIEIIRYLILLFNKQGDKATDMRVIRDENNNISIEWTMNYGRLSPRKCFITLEQK